MFSQASLQIEWIDVVQADVWPAVRAAAAAKGTSAEIATTAKYLESLLQFAGSDCQRTSDAARALTELLRSSATAGSEPSRSHRGSECSEAADLVSGSLHSLKSALEPIRDEFDGASAVGHAGASSVVNSTAAESPVLSEASVELLGSCATAEVLAAIQQHLQGSSARRSTARSARPVQALAEELQTARPAQVVRAAAACETGTESQDVDQSSATPTGAAFMKLARVLLLPTLLRD